MKKSAVQLTTVLLTLALLMAVLIVYGVKKDKSEPAAPALTPAETAAPTVPRRQVGERYDRVIMIEGMEETVHYEQIRNDTVGIEMGYEYENFRRRSGPNRECFISDWDDPDNPENYLEVTSSPDSAETVAAAIAETLSRDYEIYRDDAFMLEGAGRCIRIDASADKGGLTMPDHLQLVYIIPAPDGCRIATEHYFIVESEGFGNRFRNMMHTLTVIDRQG